MSVVVGVAACSAVAVHRSRRAADMRWLRQHTLPKALLDESIPDDALLRVWAVRIHNVRLATGAAERVRLRVKCGSPGCSIACDTEEAPVPPIALGQRPVREECAELGATCLFLAGDRLEPRVRFRLLDAGDGDRVVAASGWLFVAAPVAVLEYGNVALLRSGLVAPERIGRFDVVLSTHTVEKGRLRQCLAQAAAQLQHASVLVPSASVAEGVVAAALGEEEGEWVEGQPVRAASDRDSRLARGPTRFRLQGLCGIASRREPGRARRQETPRPDSVRAGLLAA